MLYTGTKYSTLRHGQKKPFKPQSLIMVLNTLKGPLPPPPRKQMQWKSSLFKLDKLDGIYSSILGSEQGTEFCLEGEKGTCLGGIIYLNGHKVRRSIHIIANCMALNDLHDDQLLPDKPIPSSEGHW